MAFTIMGPLQTAWNPHTAVLTIPLSWGHAPSVAHTMVFYSPIPHKLLACP